MRCLTTSTTMRARGPVVPNLLNRALPRKFRFLQTFAGCAVQGGLAGIRVELPELERLGGDALLEALRQSDLVNEPIGSAASATYFAPFVKSTSRSVRAATKSRSP